jgi:hypothetical protein
MRGLLLVQGVGYRPESMIENLDAMTLDDFKAALPLLQKDRAVVTVGDR